MAGSLRKTGRTILMLALHIAVPASLHAQPSTAEVEPNDTPATATPLTLDVSVSGLSINEDSSRDPDHFTVSLGEERWLDAQVSGSAEGNYELVLLNDTGRDRQRREGNPAQLPDLVLPPGDYIFRIRPPSGVPEGEYTFSVEDRGEPRANTEQEPNDEEAQTTEFTATDVVRGSFAGLEYDFWQMRVEGDFQTWRLQATGSGIESLRLYDASGREIARENAADGRSARLSNLLLAPGVHTMAVRGTDGNYILRALPIGPAPGVPETIQPAVVARGELAGGSGIPLTDEVEPNDTLGRTLILPWDERVTALLDSRGDVDLYHFYLAAEARLALTLEHEADAPARMRIARGVVGAYIFDTRIAPGDSEPIELLLPAGDYYLAVSADEVSEVPYGLALSRRPYYDRPDDLEPTTGDWYTAVPTPLDHAIEGRLQVNSNDWFLLPVMDQDTPLTVASADGRSGGLGLGFRVETPPDDPKTLWSRRTSRLLQSRGNPTDGWATILPAGEQVMMNVSGDVGPYALQLDFGEQGPAPITGAAPEVTLALAFENSEIAAFERQRQQVSGTLTLTNNGSTEESLKIESHVGDLRWSVELSQTGITLAPGASSDIEISIKVAPDAFDDSPVEVAVAASRAAGPQGSPAVFTQAVLTPAIDVSPIQGQKVWPLPGVMLGGFNVASVALGATPVSGYRAERLIDGLLNTSHGVDWSSANYLADDYPRIKLAGDTPHRLIGVTLSPLLDPNLANWLRLFQILVSLDGIDYQVVHEDVLMPMAAEQAFVFEQPVDARFVALRPLSSHSPDGRGNAGVAELRAIAEPGMPPPLDNTLDIARHELGGHVLRSAPYLPWQNALIEGSGAASRTFNRNENLEGFFILAFTNNRAAQITELLWRENERGNEGTLLDRVEVSVSLGSAAGPWTPIGVLDLPRAAESEVRLTLDEPVWARYVRFDYQRREGQTRLEVPARIAVFEQPVGENYHSITAAWGELEQASVYEWLLQEEQAELREDASDTRSDANLLAFNTLVHDAVALNVDEDWRRIEVPEEGGSVTLSLRNQPSVDVVLELQAEDGTPVPLALDRDTLENFRYGAWLGTGSYYLRVQEPPRSVAVLWDSSGSVAAMSDSIFRAVRSFARDIQPGREEVQFFPFSNNPPYKLLTDWTGDPRTAYVATHTYDTRQADSSKAESNLNAAVGELAERDGVRALVLITDGLSSEENLSPELWTSLENVQPRIFSLAVPSPNPDVTEGRLLRDKMQDWAAINGGYYRYLNGQQSIETNFRRLAAWLRQPAPYSLEANIEVGPPRPATLSVTGDEEDATFQGAVEIILDASGSMLAQLDGRRRIDTAKEVLSGLVNDVLPDEAPFALRVFGQGAPDSCDMNLQVPLAALDREQVANAIAQITPTNLARTPIGAALAVVPDDLQGVTGPRLVILLTDGEETCDGDPGAEIEALREAGIDMRVNIVGFAIDDAALAETFVEWARAGGGSYFAAEDNDSLGQAMTDALQRSFTVDKAGEVVASGEIGGAPLELPPGVYRVILDTGEVLEEIQLAPGANITLSATADVTED